MPSPIPESFKLVDKMTDGEVQKLFDHILKTRGDKFKDFVSDPVGEYKEVLTNPKAKLVEEPMQMLKGDIEYGKKALKRMRMDGLGAGPEPE